MNVSAVMNSEVVTCFATDDMNRAAQILWECDCGCVPVVDELNGVIGMITDRDICMAAYLQGQPLRNLFVAESMARFPVCCRPEDHLEEALRLMADAQVRRLPVVDGANRLLGMLSLSDVVQHTRKAGNAERQREADEIIAALVAVTEPRPQEGDGYALEPVARERAITPAPRARGSLSERSAGGAIPS